MAEPQLMQRERTVPRELIHLVGERHEGETEQEKKHRGTLDLAESERQLAREQITTRYAADKSVSEKAFREESDRLNSEFSTEHNATEKTYASARQKITGRANAERIAMEKAYSEERWTRTTVFEASRDTADEEFQEFQQRVAKEMQRLAPLQTEARQVLREWRQLNLRVVVSKTPYQQDEDTLKELKDCLALAEEELEQLKGLMLPRLFKGFRVFWMYVLLWGALVYPVGWYTNRDTVFWLLLNTLATLGFGSVLSVTLYLAAKRSVRLTYQALCQALFDAETARKRCLEKAAVRYERQVAANRDRKRRHDQEMRLLEMDIKRKLSDLKARRDRELAEVEETYRPKLNDLQEAFDKDMDSVEDNYNQQQKDLKDKHDKDLNLVEQRYRKILDDNELRARRTAHFIADRWRRGLAHSQMVADEIQRESRRLFPTWNDTAWKNWKPPAQSAPVVRFGELFMDLKQVPNGLPADEKLRRQGPFEFNLPAFLGFPDRCSLLFKAHGAGRAEAVQTLQAVMFRLLTSIPPGKVRFTIIDPVALGENFAAFMHLADYDELLVASRIWTEPTHIEQRLADLTAHMEMVIQKYLRNQYPTIDAYNLQAGEVAEPFRFLVVANFPTNFTPEAARRLVSIANSGARCGVYTLVIVDTQMALPDGFQMADLETPSVTLIYKDSANDKESAIATPPAKADAARPTASFVWKDPDFEAYPLTLDQPPTDEFATRILNIVGEKAKEAKRVEVSFDFIAPPPDRWWTSDSRPGLNVPLGRAGATKRQVLQLGKGTSQHVLIAGKTGSGKSTLLHALITNAALLYGPEELELYLVDFKKGVEFKTYAVHELPHARVVAIESEREFGLSVLQRLDQELKLRGDLFRDAGAQNLAAYRDSTGKQLPRILLVVDEFQEFFTEDDKLAGEAAQLLDRLVRQGRAFGMHVLLGSQTLGGAYSLARSTIDQMAVRIALQCSEADGHLILSEDNSAARLLTRPGEAIYNDANGRIEGNDPFQVVWLDDERREDLLRRVRDLDQRRRSANGHPAAPRPQIVFEGNIPADVRKNPLLADLLYASDWPATPKTANTWLGEAIAIKDPTAATFRAQSGSNLLIIGQQDELALGMLATSLLSLAAQHAPGTAKFYVLDGTPADASYAGVLGQVAEGLPHQVRIVGWRELAAGISEIAEELDGRLKGLPPDAPAVYLIINALQRFRDLRRTDDDFSFSSREDKPNTAQQFFTILREGPSLGMHTLTWVDTVNNVQRTFDRQALRDFEMRVLFQMNPGDSSNLIDSPLAAKLGVHRALFYSEEQGRLEKFRPYRPPAADWLAWVKERFAIRPATVGVGAG